MNPPTIVAEIGGNHGGSINTAKRMIEILGGYACEQLSLDRADNPDTQRRVYAKFQKRTCDESVYPDWSLPHPNPYHAFGDTYMEHRQALEFPVEVHQTLKFWSEAHGQIGYSCSVWDVPAAREIISLSPDHIKIPSACNLDWDLLDCVFMEGETDVHISTGMTTRGEMRMLADYLRGMGVGHRTVLYHCTSGYPVTAEETCLDEIKHLQDKYSGLVQAFGFSGHHKGIALDMGAVALGAEYIERHYTLDRTSKGTDHSASLEPDGMRRLIRDSAAVAHAMRTKPSDGLVDIEKAQRAKLKTGVTA